MTRHRPMTPSARTLAILAACLLLSGFARAAQPRAGAADGLKPGGYAWTPQLSPSGPLAIVVSIPAQRVYVYRNGVRIGTAATSTGRPGHETPPGVYTILEKRREHRSNLYDDAPMPFMQRLTWDGVALHAGQDPGYPASHGCIRLPRGFAEQLFAATRVGTPVVVAGADALPALSAPGLFSPLPTASATAKGAASPAPGAEWAPDRAPAGPVSVLLSTRDATLVVVRNGVEIGRTAVIVAPELRRGVGTWAWQRLAAANTATPGTGTPDTAQPRPADAAPDIDPAATPGTLPEADRWIRLPVDGAIADGDARLRAAFADGRIAVPADFAARLAALLQPGTTAIVTDQPLAGAGPLRDVLSTEDEEAR